MPGEVDAAGRGAVVGCEGWMRIGRQVSVDRS